MYQIFRCILFLCLLPSVGKWKISHCCHFFFFSHFFLLYLFNSKLDVKFSSYEMSSNLHIFHLNELDICLYCVSSTTNVLIYLILFICSLVVPLFCYTCVFPSISPLNCLKFPTRCPPGQLCLSSKAVGQRGM